MNLTTSRQISLEEFLNRPEDRCELVEGELKPKVSPKYKHSKTQGRLYRRLDEWCEQQQTGRVLTEWGVILKRQERDWVPVPDLTYVSYERLPQTWEEDALCPVKPELVIEIISPGQTFGRLTKKAEDYLNAGVDRAWIIDPQAQTVSIFRQEGGFETRQRNEHIVDSLLPELSLPIADLFEKPN
jgi:Uma2 family endonuclease